MTVAEIDVELTRLEKEYWSALQTYLLGDNISCGTTERVPIDVLIKNLTNEYYEEKNRLESLRTCGAGDDFDDI